jgi:transposase
MSGGKNVIQVRRLTETEERVLKEWASSRQSSEMLALRAQVILLSSQKWTVPRISMYLGLHHHSVRTRIRRFNNQGIDGLIDRPRSGRPRIYGQAERQTVCQLAQTDPASLGLPLHAWTLSALQRHLAESGVAPAIGRETIRRILLASATPEAQVDMQN